MDFKVNNLESCHFDFENEKLTIELNITHKDTSRPAEIGNFQIEKSHFGTDSSLHPKLAYEYLSEILNYILFQKK